MKKTFLAILCLISIQTFADDCINWGAVMNKVEIESMPKGRRVLVLKPFENFTELEGDNWLSDGIPFILAKLLSTGEEITVIDQNMAKYHPSAGKQTYTVEGMFQHVEGRLRVFVKFLERGTLKKQFQLDMSYPENRQFFDTISDTAIQILALASPHYNAESFEQMKKATSVLPAFENFMRGLLAYWQYDAEQLDIAKTFFDEAKKADVNFVWAYESLAKMYEFVALYNKQNSKPYGAYLELAEAETAKMKKFANRPEPPKRPKQYVIKFKEEPFLVTNRWLLGHAAFIAGLDSAGKKKWNDAAKNFEEALRYVPEDAIGWMQLADMNEKAGNKKGAAHARAKAFELNKCLQ